MMKIDAADYAAVAREIGLAKQVTVEEAVIVDGVETKPAVVEEELLTEPEAAFAGVPLDKHGNPIEWTNLTARETVLWRFKMIDVEQDPKSTPENPLPPLNTDRYEKLIIVGRDKAAMQALYEAKLTAAKAVVEAAKELPAPVEGEAVEGKLLP